MRLLKLCLTLLCLAIAAPALAHDPSSPYASWYNNAQLTPAAKLRLGISRCCSGDDVVETQFKSNQNKPYKDVYYYLKDGEWLVIPPDIIHWGEHAPDGRATLFALKTAHGSLPVGTPTCFYPPKVNGQ